MTGSTLPQALYFGDYSLRLDRGQQSLWLPRIQQPLPRLGGLLKRCPSCSRSFLTFEGYEGHYALVHVLQSVEPS